MLQDSNGLITEDLESLKNVGTLRPLRSYPDTSSHKIYCLGPMVNILLDVLSGANFWNSVLPFVNLLIHKEDQVSKEVGHIFIAF